MLMVVIVVARVMIKSNCSDIVVHDGAGDEGDHDDDDDHMAMTIIARHRHHIDSLSYFGSSAPHFIDLSVES